MADYDVKAVAAALREIVNEHGGYHDGIYLRKRADELDPPPPPKSRADRIVDQYRGQYPAWGGEGDLRRILKEEGIE